MSRSKSGIERAVKAAGSTSALAKRVGVSRHAVEKWVAAKRVGAGSVIAVYDATGVHPSDLNPEIFPRDRVTVAPLQFGSIWDVTLKSLEK
jgi:DNA-binding transcriptional regulator YdaS (Cro superfamily)